MRKWEYSRTKIITFLPSLSKIPRSIIYIRGLKVTETHRHVSAFIIIFVTTNNLAQVMKGVAGSFQ